MQRKILLNKTLLVFAFALVCLGGLVAQKISQPIITTSVAYVSPMSYGTITDGGKFGDGLAHPASSNGFSTLGALQTKYSFATSLTNDIAGLMIQAAINAADAAGTGIQVQLPAGSFRTLPSGWNLPSFTKTRLVGVGWATVALCANAGTNPCLTLNNQPQIGVGEFPVANISFQGFNAMVYPPGNENGVPVNSMFTQGSRGIFCYQCVNTTFESLQFENFDLPLDWDTSIGNNYIVTCRDCDFHYNNKGYSINLGAPNSFEKMTCDTCTIGNNNYGVWLNFTNGANVVASAGASFTGVGNGTTLTVSGVTGYISTGSVDALFGTGIPGNTTIISQSSGTPGGAGVYLTNNATTVNGAVTDVSNQLIVSKVISGSLASGQALYGYNIPLYFSISSGSGNVWVLNNLLYQPVAEQMSTEASTVGADAFFINSSIDYNIVNTAVVLAGAGCCSDNQTGVYFIGSHFETSSARSGTAPRIINAGNITFIGGYFDEEGAVPQGEVAGRFYACTSVIGSKFASFAGSDSAAEPFVYAAGGSTQQCVQGYGNTGRVSQYSVLESNSSGMISAADWADLSGFVYASNWQLALIHQRKSSLLAGSVTITVPTNATSPWAIGQWTKITAPNGVTGTIAAASGVTLSGTLTFTSQTATLTYIGSNAWQITY